ncbi:MAG TPA: hypothetical protein VGZ91_17255 [Candidatus Sulfotelmatobacter sp.]|jgi:hypothetical protein|nr:hypothetical protein [Candidatus Sulfotelmatobacter sp.]
MKRVMFTLCVLTLVVTIGPQVRVQNNPVLTMQVNAQGPTPACTPPMSVGSSVEQTAWQLFVAATCPVDNSKYPYVAWEKWIEQSQLYGGPGAAALAPNERPRFHMSPLARIMQEKEKAKNALPTEKLISEAANEDCNHKTWTKRVICEEARLNPEAESYVKSEKLTTRQGQINFVNAGKPFMFPPPAVEIKADWIQLNSCANPPEGVHVEMVGKYCYALGGIHLISKLIDKWIWATFEPQNADTNPRRCIVLGCKDSWGSNPATSSGKSTELTTALSDLMTQANLAKEWRNYRLDGVQTDFLEGGQPTRLGNSIIEGENAGNPQKMAVSSCITCHDLSTINKQGQSMSPDFIVGVPTIQPGYVTRDFVWSLGLAH